MVSAFGELRMSEDKAVNNKYLRTARLGENVIYVLPQAMETISDRREHAGRIIKQLTETVVNLRVTFADGSESIICGVEFDPMAERPGSWANVPKT